MYNIAVLEANQNQAALLKALIEKNVHKEVLNVITCPSIVELAKYLSDGNIASMLFVDVWMGEEENFSRENATPKGIGIVEKKAALFHSRSSGIHGRSRSLHACNLRNRTCVFSAKTFFAAGR